MKTTTTTRRPLAGGSVTGATPARGSSLASKTPSTSTAKPTTKQPLTPSSGPTKFAPLKKASDGSATASASETKAFAPAAPATTPAGDVGQTETCASIHGTASMPDAEPARSVAAFSDNSQQSTADSPVSTSQAPAATPSPATLPLTTDAL
ncbi:hypothetical protein Agub_g3115, partial [Astrephomene gubernaculifera]